MGEDGADKRSQAQSGNTNVSNRDILLTGFLEDLRNDALLLELEVHLSLVGLDLDQDVAGSNSVTGLLLPSTNVSGRHGR